MEGWVPSGAWTSSAGEFAGHTFTFHEDGEKRTLWGPADPETILIFRISFTIPFLLNNWARPCVQNHTHSQTHTHTHTHTHSQTHTHSPGGKSIYSQHLSAPNAWTQSQKVNNEGIYVVRVRMLRPRRLESINKYKCNTFCEIFIA